jgi:ribose-phosphate pyrophosphokinase
VIVIAGKSHPVLAKSIAEYLSVPFILANTKTFADLELRIQLKGQFQGQEVVIVQSTSRPANDHLMELLLIADAVKRAGAAKIIAMIPYFGYCRQDRPSYEYGPISASLVASLLAESGIDRVITMDLHSKQSEGFFKMEILNIDAVALFLPILRNRSCQVVVSPDIGGVSRAKQYAALLGADLAIINKQRKPNGECLIGQVIGEVRHKDCVIIDDILDTGGTLCQAAESLKQKGAKSVSSCLTHAVMSKECLSRLRTSSLDSIYVTDSVFQENNHLKIKTVSVAKVMSNAISKVRV